MAKQVRISTAAKEIAKAGNEKKANVSRRIRNALKASPTPFAVQVLDGMTFVDLAGVKQWYDSKPVENRGRAPQSLHKRIATYLGMDVKEVGMRWEQAGSRVWSPPRPKGAKGAKPAAS
ncbi:MAG: hypothetical protein M3Y88_00140 [Chloroflexota bacterium]|nr:hypothetical protein [Chloroflexota bacterium]